VTASGTTGALGAGLAVGLLVAVLAGCAGTAGPGAPVRPATVAPLTSSASNAAASWVTVPMGHLDDPLNTFWQVLVRPAASSQWRLVTPPGVADNGGLVLSAPAGSQAVVGFRASQVLAFSPLAATVDLGRSYTPQLVPAALAAVPDALAAGTVGDAAALVDDGAEVMTARGDPTGAIGFRWQRDVSLSALAASAGPGCGLTRLSAVAVTADATYIGGSCRRAGRVAIVEQVAGGNHLVPVVLPSGAAEDQVDVVRLAAAGDKVSALLALHGANGSAFAAAWSSPGGASWAVSGELPARARLVSTSTTAQTGFAVLTSSPDGALAVAVCEPGQQAWAQLPAPPQGTVAIAVADRRVDALAVDPTRVVDFVLTAGGATWSRSQVTTVPIPFGSSQ
jgi:hypothetical protein